MDAAQTGFVSWRVALAAETSCWRGCPALAELYGYKLQGLMGNCLHCRAFRRELTRGNDDYDHAGHLDTLSKAQTLTHNTNMQQGILKNLISRGWS